MELKHYLRIIKSESKLILEIALLTAVFALAFSAYLPAKFEASVSLFINKNGSQPTEQFKYDGFYALESGEIVADNVEKMLQSPQTVESIYRQSGVDPNLSNIKGYKKRFTAHKMSNQYVEVSFSSKNKDDAQKVSTALIQTVNQNLEAAANKSGNEVAFTVEDTKPVIVENKVNLPQSTLLGILSGLFLGLFAAFLKTYLHSK